jgi:hypothetical protein
MTQCSRSPSRSGLRQLQSQAEWATSCPRGVLEPGVRARKKRTILFFLLSSRLPNDPSDEIESPSRSRGSLTAAYSAWTTLESESRGGRKIGWSRRERVTRCAQRQKGSGTGREDDAPGPRVGEVRPGHYSPRPLDVNSPGKSGMTVVCPSAPWSADAAIAGPAISAPRSPRA